MAYSQTDNNKIAILDTKNFSLVDMLEAQSKYSQIKAASIMDLVFTSDDSLMVASESHLYTYDLKADSERS